MTTTDTFDKAKPLVMARFGTLRGHALNAGAPVTIAAKPEGRGEVTEAEAELLWNGGRLVYAAEARPTPVESAEDAADRLTVMEPLEPGLFLIRAPWLGEGERVQGREAADKRRAEIVQAGIDLHRNTTEVAGSGAAAAALGNTDGFVMTEAGSNGYYEITGPGIEPERVRGRANAEQRLAELRGEAAGPTEQIEEEQGA
jgi:hypothetical protein